MVNADQPTPEQLAPVQDNTNPLYIKVGNPFLKSCVTHLFNSEIRYFFRDYKWHAAVSGSGSVTNNQIVQDAYYDTVGRQISTFQNVNGTKQFNIKVGFGSRVRFSEWNFTFDVSSGVNTNKSIGFVNRQQNNCSSIQFNPQVQFGMNYKSNFFFHTNAGVNFNSTGNSLDASMISALILKEYVHVEMYSCKTIGNKCIGILYL
jgi:hypothetical protein